MKQRQSFVCRSCGARSSQWRGQCPQCQEWNTLEAVVVPAGGARRATRPDMVGSPVTLAEMVIEPRPPVSTGVAPLDELLGGGLTPGSVLLLGGEPGVGKSTLFLQVAGSVAANRPALYVTGEETLEQLKHRADRLGALEPGLMALAATSVDQALAALDSREAWGLVVADSVQTLTSSRAEGLPGSVSQVRAVATELVEAARARNLSLVLVGHVTKDGQLAGPKLLEHMVDTVLSLEGERRHGARLLRVLKNRFGPAQELLVFRMTVQGMEAVEDPATFFLEDRKPGLPGAAVVMAVEGGRPLAVEVQALASRSYLNIPRRAALGLDTNRLHLLLAVLEKRLGLNFGQTDIYVKVGGGLRIEDPGLDLGLAGAVLSSFYDRALPDKAVFWGEVDLNGQVRPVERQEQRLLQSKRLGLSPVYCPGSEHLRGNTIQALKDALQGDSHFVS